MFKLPRTALEWIHLFWMTACGAVVLILLSMFVQIIWLGSNFKAWDVLAFFGSIIGGIITWIGVRASIKHSEEIITQERQQKELDLAPSKIRALDKIESELDTLIEMYSSIAEELHRNGKIMSASSLLNTKEAMDILMNIVDQSIIVDARTYMTLIDLEKGLKRVERRRRFIITLMENTRRPVNDVVDELQTMLMRLQHHTEVAHSKVVEIRRQYLKLIFVDDPNIFS